MKIGYAAMRLAIILYILPFLFVISPSLLLQGPAVYILVDSVTAVLGIILMAGGIERYILGVGMVTWPWAIPFIISGVLLVYPLWSISLVGLGIYVLAMIGVKLPRVKKVKALKA